MTNDESMRNLPSRRRSSRIVLAGALLFGTSSLAPVAASADPPNAEGDWINPAGSVIVRISPCEAAICGVVTWASAAAQNDARRAGTVQLVGTHVLYGFVPAGANQWRGRLFIPDLRRSTRAKIKLTEPDELVVIGCELAGLICKKQTWRRTPRPIDSRPHGPAEAESHSKLRVLR